MSTSFIDLHCHSTKSDGTLTPTQLVELALKKHLSAIALTDHDNVSGIEEAVNAAKSTDLEVVPGIEFSTEYNGIDVHIVGLYFDWQDPTFREQCEEFVNERVNRNKKMAALLCKAGFDMPYEKIEAAFPGSVLTRAHFGRYMKEHGYVKEISEAFEKYIGEDCPYFVPREKISPEKAIAFTKKFHGFAILAHPFQYNLGDEGLDTLVQCLKAAGLGGIEAYYNNHTKEQTQKIIALAEKYDLLLSGGSDFHGSNKPGIDLGTGYGDLRVPAELLTKIKHRLHGTSDDTKIFFCDFDGTLATSEKAISEKTRKALDDFTDRGGIFVFSSGRAMTDVREILNRTNLHYKDMYVSAYNGAEIWNPETKVTYYRETLPMEVVHRAFELADKMHLYIQVYDGDVIVTKKHTKEIDYYTRTVHMDVRYDEAPDQHLLAAPCKCLVIDLDDPKRKIPPFAKALSGAFPGKVRCLMSNANYLEIDPVNATKGNALRWLCRFLGIPVANSYAAGDAPNDIPAIEAAGCGILMKNARDAAPTKEDADRMEQAADVITTEDNDHDGLVPFIEKMR